LVHKPQPSTPVLVPSATFNRLKPIRFNFPETRNPSHHSSTRREDYSPAINSVSNVEESEEIFVSESQDLIPYDCLQCLCQASSKCDLNKGCDGAYCGPYLLSWGYWADGGKPGGEYATCSKQKPCSEIAIQSYMAKWKRDCNHDGKIDCIDFALIHKLGPHG
ncbi:Destabilase-like protein, partial [Euroglyphus maynei]